LARQHLAPQYPAVPAGPYAAPGVLRRALVENDAAVECDREARRRGDAHALDPLRADLPHHAVGLAVLDDTDDARIALSTGVHALRVVDAGDGVARAGIAGPPGNPKQ